MDLVIGSGPAGVSAAMALIARGRDVTMIDGGRDLPEALLARKQGMAACEPSEWTTQQVADWQSPQFEKSGDGARRYGSDHAQNDIDDGFAPAPWFAGRSSFAVGGLSNVWGSAVLPNRQADLSKWPITSADLAPHYKAVGAFMPIAGRVDTLQALLPDFDMSAQTPLSPGPQGRALLERFDAKAEKLRTRGVYAGQARQAVRADCKLCGMCLHGCPWDKIYSAGQTLQALQASPRFHYRAGHIAVRFEADDGAGNVMFGDGGKLAFDRLFIAAGVYETARLVLASQSDQHAHLTLRDSRHFLLPMLHAWRSGSDPSKRPHHTLAEAFVEMDDPTVSPYLTHTQIYGWNEFYAREMIQNYGSKLPALGPFFRTLARRLMVAQSFIHSDHCDTVDLSLDQATGKLKTSLNRDPLMPSIIKAAERKLMRSMSQVGLHGLGFASRLGAPGASFHSGGTLPMSNEPRALQTDPLGRLNGYNNVHIVDASVLPSIPATTITFSVMANAHRIASLV